MCVLCRLCFRLIYSLKVALFIFLSIFGVLYLFWVLLINRQVLPPSMIDTNKMKIIKYGKESGNNGSENVKYVLLWHHSDVAPFYYFLENNVFVKNNCSFTNCHVTSNKEFFGGDLSKFHAIGFNGRMLDHIKPSTVPRSSYQKFIYFNTESPANYKISNPDFDGFFNWTSTYRLDSDVPYPYILIRNSSGDVIGPKISMAWEQNMTDIDEDVDLWIRHKSKAAVTFVSNCATRSNREYYIDQLAKELKSKGVNLDVYGACGDKQCRRSEQITCDALVDQYYFYLAFENSLCKDYVTEKLLRALNHNTVPIVFGGAQYSRFLPPGSYLNMQEHQPRDLAKAMVDLMKNPNRYRKYFSWKKHYSYHNPMSTENVCTLCAVLNNQTNFRMYSEYPNIRAWWNNERF